MTDNIVHTLAVAFIIRYSPITQVGTVRRPLLSRSITLPEHARSLTLLTAYPHKNPLNAVLPEINVSEVQQR